MIARNVFPCVFYKHEVNTWQLENSSEVIGHVVAGAEHGLGFYTDRPEIAAEVVDTTVEFFHTHL